MHALENYLAILDNLYVTEVTASHSKMADNKKPVGLVENFI